MSRYCCVARSTPDGQPPRHSALATATTAAPSDVDQLLVAKREQGLSDSTVRLIYTVLRRALDYAVRDGLVRRNVATAIDRPTVAHREAAVLSPAKAQALLEAARGQRLYALFAVAMAVGLRRGEALALRWSDVGLDAGTLRVSRTLSRTAAGLVFTEPKTARSRRTIPLPAALVEELRGHGTRQLAERLAAGSLWRDHDLVFPRLTGTPLDPRNALRALTTTAARAGLDGDRPAHVAAHMRQPPARPGRPPASGHGDTGALRHLDNDGHLLARDAAAAARGSRPDAKRVAVVTTNPWLHAWLHSGLARCFVASPAGR